MKHAKVLALALSALFISSGALASDRASSASVRGPGEGGGACSFVYSIQKIGPTIADENEAVTFHVFVRNEGDCRLRHIDVTDVLPHGFTYVSSLPLATSENHGHIRWDNVEIQEGRYIDFQIQATVDSDLHHDNRYLTNTGCAFTPRIGTEICDSVTTFVPWHHNRAN